MTSVRTVLFLLVSGSLFAGCSLAPRTSLPEPVAELPGDFTESLTTGPHEPVEWWLAFADPALNAVVDSVLTSNFDLAGGIARVQQARARARIARAAFFSGCSGWGGRQRYQFAHQRRHWCTTPGVGTGRGSGQFAYPLHTTRPVGAHHL